MVSGRPPLEEVLEARRNKVCLNHPNLVFFVLLDIQWCLQAQKIPKYLNS